MLFAETGIVAHGLARLIQLSAGGRVLMQSLQDARLTVLIEVAKNRYAECSQSCQPTNILVKTNVRKIMSCKKIISAIVVFYEIAGFNHANSASIEIGVKEYRTGTVNTQFIESAVQSDRDKIYLTVSTPPGCKLSAKNVSIINGTNSTASRDIDQPPGIINDPWEFAWKNPNADASSSVTYSLRLNEAAMTCELGASEDWTWGKGHQSIKVFSIFNRSTNKMVHADLTGNNSLTKSVKMKIEDNIVILSSEPNGQRKIWDIVAGNPVINITGISGGEIPLRNTASGKNNYVNITLDQSTGTLFWDFNNAEPGTYRGNVTVNVSMN